MVRFYDSRTRTCIGGNGLSSLLHALYEPLLSDLNTAYVYKQKRYRFVKKSWNYVKLVPRGAKMVT